MATSATMTATITSWDESTYFEGEGGAKLTRATVGQAIAGDLEGEGTTEYLMCYRPDGSASYVGQQRVEGSLGGRRGSFAVHATGAYEGAGTTWTWSVVAGSGTGELAGLRGEGTGRADKEMQVAMTFDYDID